MKREGSTTSSPSSECTAVTTTRSVARLTARWNRWRSSFKRSAMGETGVAGSIPSSTRSTRSSWRMSVPVSLSVGHDNSWTPETITRLNSRPAAPCAVSSGTASGVAVRRSRTPVGNSCSSMCAIKDSTVALGRRSVKSPAASNSAIIASKSRSACEPAAPPRSAIAMRLSASFVADQIAHSTSSTLPPSPRAVRPASSTLRMRFRIASSRSVSTEPKSGSSSSNASNSESVTSARVSGFHLRSPRSRRRSVTGSVPPTGPSSRSRHWAMLNGSVSAFSPNSIASTMRCSASTTSVGFTATGTSACSSARRSDSIIPTERTTTDISRQATLSSRCQRRRRSTTAAWLTAVLGAITASAVGWRFVAPRSITSAPSKSRKNSGDAPRKRKTDCSSSPPMTVSSASCASWRTS